MLTVYAAKHVLCYILHTAQFQAQHGQIVELRGFADEFIDAALDTLYDLLRGFLLISIECLYGHLSVIVVNENDVVEAGDIVAISGNTGKSTGPHLHLRLRKDGKSIDPQPFVNYLNDYIDDLQERIATLKFGGKPDRELNIENLARVLEQYHVKYPKIVIAQSLLETGYYTSRVCWECKNLFGLRRPSDGSYYKFDRWEDSVKAYRDYVQYKYKGGDYLQFLNRIGYAEDKSYVLKVRQIAKTL